MQAIVLQWEKFASSRVPSGSTMTQLELRDHVQEILLAVANSATSWLSSTISTFLRCAAPQARPAGIHWRR